MGMIKEQWGIELEKMENVMNDLTREHGQVLAFADYLWAVVDYWGENGLEDYIEALEEHHEYLLDLEKAGLLFAKDKRPI
jgi:hypothetical protein